jgi:maltooligosyltrehalose trehalohydrolase
MDTLWNDDFHHTAMVRLTGRTEAYYTDYRGTAEEFLAVAKWGYLYQGQWYHWHKNGRGTAALDLPAAAFVNYLQNHDQIANSGRGERIDKLTSPARLRAMTALWLLLPQTPLVFQGQEFAASNPFLYFADNDAQRRKLVAEGRAKFLAQFPSLALPEVQRQLPDPGDAETFRRCKLDHAERERHAETWHLHRDLLRLRREDPVFATQDASRAHGATLGPDAFLLRYFGREHGDRLLLVNFGPDLELCPVPQPLLASPAGLVWNLLWTSDDVRYGGLGNPFRDYRERWSIRGEAVTVLTAE